MALTDTQVLPEIPVIPIIDDELEDAPKPHSDDEIRDASLAPLRTGEQKAASTMSTYHQKWHRFRRLYSSRWAGDLTTESPILNEMYIPKIAELIDFANASELQQMLPDPQSMDFVSVASQWPGLEEEALTGEALLRQKLRLVRTTDSTSLYQAILRFKQDLRVCGNLLLVVTHDFYSGDLDGDEVSEGPVPQRIDPCNWIPWSTTAGSVHGCAHTIYAPLTEDEVDRVTYIDAAELRNKVAPRELTRTETPQADASMTFSDTTYGPSDMGWERKIYLGPLPWYAIKEGLGEPSWGRKDVVNALAGVFGFSAADDQHWWIGEYVDGYLMRLRPYPLALPEGLGPLLHATYYQVNDELIGRGAYDRLEQSERFYNEYNRLLHRMGRLAAEPPVVMNPDLLDEDWLAEHEQPGPQGTNETFLAPGETIPLRRGLGQGSLQGMDPYKPLEIGSQGIMEEMRREMERIEVTMRGDMQVSTDYTGQSGARTATQAQNNLLQSRNMEGHWIKMSENGWLLELMQRMYVVMRQVIQMRGETVSVPVSDGERKLRVCAINPESVRALSYFSISVNGSSAAINKSSQTQLLMQLLSLLLPVAPQYDFKVATYAETILQTAGLRGTKKFFGEVGDVQEMLNNLVALAGTGGLSMLPPDVQQAIQQLAAATAPEQGLLPAPGAPGAPASPGMQGQTAPVRRANFGARAMPGMPPMRGSSAPSVPGLAGVA